MMSIQLTRITIANERMNGLTLRANVFRAELHNVRGERIEHAARRAYSSRTRFTPFKFCCRIERYI
jgi:hypothetical protein